jgi:hypothetical protein
MIKIVIAIEGEISSLLRRSELIKGFQAGKDRLGATFVDPQGTKKAVLRGQLRKMSTSQRSLQSRRRNGRYSKGLIQEEEKWKTSHSRSWCGEHLIH